MVKPIGYWTNFTPGDNSLFSEMESDFGSHFERLSETEKAWLLFTLGHQLYMDAEGELRETVRWFSDRARKEIDNLNKLGLIQALVEQIKGGE